MPSLRVMMSQGSQKPGGKTHMTRRPQWMAKNCFRKIGKEEDEVELHFM